jgi:hypothetical protein
VIKEGTTDVVRKAEELEVRGLAFQAARATSRRVVEKGRSRVKLELGDSK